MERLSVIFLSIIFIYLLFAFLKSRKKNTKNESKSYEPRVEDSNENKFVPVIIAAISAAMENRPYVIKRVFLKGSVDEKISTWKIAGRSERMLKKTSIK